MLPFLCKLKLIYWNVKMELERLQAAPLKLFAYCIYQIWNMVLISGIIYHQVALHCLHVYIILAPN